MNKVVIDHADVVADVGIVVLLALMFVVVLYAYRKGRF